MHSLRGRLLRGEGQRGQGHRLREHLLLRGALRQLHCRPVAGPRDPGGLRPPEGVPAHRLHQIVSHLFFINYLI